MYDRSNWRLYWLSSGSGLVAQQLPSSGSGSSAARIKIPKDLYRKVNFFQVLLLVVETSESWFHFNVTKLFLALLPLAACLKAVMVIFEIWALKVFGHNIQKENRPCVINFQAWAKGYIWFCVSSVRRNVDKLMIVERFFAKKIPKGYFCCKTVFCSVLLVCNTKKVG